MNVNRVHVEFLKGEEHKMPFTNSCLSLRIDKGSQRMIRCAYRIFDKYKYNFHFNIHIPVFFYQNFIKIGKMEESEGYTQKMSGQYCK